MKSFAFKSILSIALLALGTPIAIAASGTIGPGFTGAWFDPAQSGHGLFVESAARQPHPGRVVHIQSRPGRSRRGSSGRGTYAGNTATLSVGRTA